MNGLARDCRAIHPIVTHPLRTVVFPLASAVEVSHPPLTRIVTPAAQEGVEVINYFRRRFVALAWSGFLSNRIPSHFQRLLGGHHIEVAFVAPVEVAVITRGEPEETEIHWR